MKKMIKLLNDYGYKVVISKEKIYIHNSNGYVVISYERFDKVIQTLEKVDTYIMDKFIQLVAEIEMIE